MPPGACVSEVCDVFVCSIWKAAGLFKEIDDDFSLLVALLLVMVWLTKWTGNCQVDVLPSQTRDSVDLDTPPRYLQIWHNTYHCTSYLADFCSFWFPQLILFHFWVGDPGCIEQTNLETCRWFLGCFCRCKSSSCTSWCQQKRLLLTAKGIERK